MHLAGYGDMGNDCFAQQPVSCLVLVGEMIYWHAPGMADDKPCP